MDRRHHKDPFPVYTRRAISGMYTWAKWITDDNLVPARKADGGFNIHFCGILFIKTALLSRFEVYSTAVLLFHCFTVLLVIVRIRIWSRTDWIEILDHKICKKFHQEVQLYNCLTDILDECRKWSKKGSTISESSKIQFNAHKFKKLVRITKIYNSL